MEGIEAAGHHRGDLFFQCAAIFLPYLNPAELASISSACSALYQIARSIAARRASDASRFLEQAAIPFLNPVAGDSQLYSYFIYSPTQVHQMKEGYRQAWGLEGETTVRNSVLLPNPEYDPFIFRVEGASGCSCVDRGENCDSCACVECGPSCTCNSRCANRLTQGGVSQNLKIVKDWRKGWGLHAAELIREGTFLCEYAGELLSTKEARKRQQIYDRQGTNGLTPALLVVKEHLPSGKACIRINIDATRIGNVARFINHACDGGNLDTGIVRSSGSLLPRVCFFASRDIQENEELCFSYGSATCKPNCRKCFCGTSSCTGFLPSEHT